MRLSLLLSKGFLLGLFILIINDHLLKENFGNWLTGKLSDFAGLFILPIFLTALFPKAQLFNYLVTFLFFIFWKTELSQPFIDYIKHSGYVISRVVDYTDFIAFSILPVSYFYVNRHSDFLFKFPYQKVIAYSAGIIAFIAFSATTPIRKSLMYSSDRIFIDEEYKSKLERDVFLDSIKTVSNNFSVDTAKLSWSPDTLYIAEFLDINQLRDTVSYGEIHFRIKAKRRGSKINFRYIRSSEDEFSSSQSFRERREQVRKIAERLIKSPLN